MDHAAEALGQLKRSDSIPDDSASIAVALVGIGHALLALRQPLAVIAAALNGEEDEEELASRPLDIIASSISDLANGTTGAGGGDGIINLLGGIVTSTDGIRTEVADLRAAVARRPVSA